MGRNETRVIHRNEFSTASIVGAHDTHNPPFPTTLEGATTILRNGEAAGVGSPARLPRGSAPLPWDTGQAPVPLWAFILPVPFEGPILYKPR